MTVEFKAGKATFNKEATKWGYIKGTAKWAHILKVNQYGNYSIDLYGENIQDLGVELGSILDEAYEAVVGEGKKANKADVFKESDEGNYLQFKQKEAFPDGNLRVIDVFDARGNKVTGEFTGLIGNGSTIKVKYSISPYYMASTKNVGLSFKMYAIQVIDLVEYSGGDSGFDDETDGEF